MTQEDTLLKDLDEGRWVTMKALADDAEERGKPILAVGYRVLANLRRWPGNAAKRKYRWQFKDMDPKTLLQLRHKLPYALVQGSYMKSVSFFSLPLFMKKTAVALGMWIRDGCPVEDRYGGLQEEYKKVFCV